jgi:tetratricopeptide (TPR) repeat protein
MDVIESPRIDELRRRVNRDPTSIAFAQLAEECRRVGEYQEAVNVCRAGLACHPSYLSARVTLGRALMELEQLADAQEELEAVLGLAPDNLAAIRALADIHLRRGDDGETFQVATTTLTPGRGEPLASVALTPAPGEQAAATSSESIEGDDALTLDLPPSPDFIPWSLEPDLSPSPPPTASSAEPRDPVIDELEQWLAAIAHDRSKQG